MKKNRLSFGLVSMLVFLAVIAAPVYAGAKLPEKMIGYAWIANPNRLLGDLEKFSQELDIPPFTTMILKMALGGLLENDNLVGVNMDGPLCLISFSPDEADSWAVCFSLSNPDSYLRTIKKILKLKSEDEETGVAVYTKEVTEFDGEAYNEASEEEKKDSDKFYRTEEKSIALAIKDKTAWLSLNPDILKEVRSFSLADFKRPVKGALLIALRVQPLLDIAEKGMREGLESLDMEVGEASSPFSPEATRELFQSYLDLYLYYGRQIETISLGFTLNGDGVALEEVIEPKPGSPLEEFLKGQKKGDLSLARYLEPGPWLVIDGRMEKPEMLVELYRRFFDVLDGILKELDAATGVKDAGTRVAKIKQSYLESVESYLTKCAGDEMAFSISSTPDAFISAVAIQKIKDPKAYREYIKQSFLENLDIVMPLYKEMGISLDVSGVKDPSTYKGADIFTAKIQFDWKKLLKKEELTDDEKRAFSLFEDPMIIQMAATGDLAVAEMSWGGKPDIKGRIDLIAAGKSSFNLKELGDGRKDANGILYFSINRYIGDLLSGMIKKMAPADVPAPQAEVLDKLARLDLPLIILYTVDGADLKVATRIAMEKIQAVKAVIEEMNKADAPQPPAQAD